MAEQPRLATESIAGQRPYQEDAVLTTTLEDGRTLVAVADGMGGHAAGEVASALALETLVEAVGGGQSLEDAFVLANQRVHEKAREPGKQGMGTTMVAALLDGDSYQVGNVGDSRCYVLSEQGIRQITDDHSFVAEALKRGQSEEEALASQWKDALTRSIGIDGEVRVDVFGPFPVEQETALLLCSDGLYKVMSAQTIRQMYGLSGGPRGAAQSLVAQAFEDGSDDNISVAIAEFGEMPRERGQGTMPIEYEPPADDDPGPAAGDPGQTAAASADTPAEAVAPPADDAGGEGAPGPTPMAPPDPTPGLVKEPGPPIGLIVVMVIAVIAIAIAVLT